MTALESLEWLERPPMVEDIDQNDQEEIIEPQVSENPVQSCPEIMTHLNRIFVDVSRFDEKIS